MQSWERRLRDLGQLLKNCEATYFDPELFRMNTNQFLQTARTVTFLIQKQKSVIPDFANWYEANVLKAWVTDEVMSWAKDSRNKIEKEGDLDLQSSLNAVLIFSYIEKHDVALACGDQERLGGNVKRLVHLARQRLPPGVSHDAVIKLERRWVANTLLNWELLHALTYVYGRLYECCSKLARHLSLGLDKSVPHTTDFDDSSTDARKIRYIRLKDFALIHAESRTVGIRLDAPPPGPVADVLATLSPKTKPTTLSENVSLYARVAQATFQQHGHHVPMLFLFNEQFEPIDALSTEFEDQSSKFVFCRLIASRIAYLRAASIVWISEAWIRDAQHLYEKPMGHLPIVGETLIVLGYDKDGRSIRTTWVIRRHAEGDKPILEEASPEEAKAVAPPREHLAPVKAAFDKVWTAQP
jgi:hypothetical protein